MPVMTSQDIAKQLAMGAIKATPSPPNGNIVIDKTEVVTGRQASPKVHEGLRNALLKTKHCDKCGNDIVNRAYPNHVANCDGNIRTVRFARAKKEMKNKGNGLKRGGIEMYEPIWDDDNNIIEMKVVPATRVNKERIAKEMKKGKKTRPYVRRTPQVAPKVDAPIASSPKVYDASDLEAFISIMEERIADSDVTFKEWNLWKEATANLWGNV